MFLFLMYYFFCSFLMNTNEKQIDENSNDKKMNDQKKMKNDDVVKII